MNSTEFRKHGLAMVEYIANYMDKVGDRRVIPNVDPGYLHDLLPTEPPQKAEEWSKIMEDVETQIMPGVTHWQHPHFHAYFPSGNSYPSILGDMLSDGLGIIGFSWASSPACTELETIVLDWLGKMLGLPQLFLAFGQSSVGGGVIQGSASECMLVTLLAARADKIRHMKCTNNEFEEEIILTKLVAYCSKDAHSCVEKAAMVSFVRLRILEPDENRSLRGDTLRKAMKEDIANGLIPFYVEATLGTTACCSFDNIAEIGPICQEMDVWLHVDGAYAGNSFICPELRGPMQGIELASSFNLNPNKFLLTNFDCSVLWVKDKYRFTQALVVDPLYLQHSQSENSIDYRHWGLSLSRRFRSLKLWFVIRSYGVEGLQKYIREHCRLARHFESLVRQDKRFEISSPVHLGLVCFRLKGSNKLNTKFLSSINASGKIHMVPASVGDKYIIRFCVCAEKATVEDIEFAWDVIDNFASGIEVVLEENRRSSLKTNKVVTLNEDEVFSIDQTTRRSIRSKRKQLYRMVSDINMYNPNVLQQQERRTSTDNVQTPTVWYGEQQQIMENEKRRFSVTADGNVNVELINKFAGLMTNQEAVEENDANEEQKQNGMPNGTNQN